jgi:hypothetical protein
MYAAAPMPARVHPDRRETEFQMILKKIEKKDRRDA